MLVGKKIEKGNKIAAVFLDLHRAFETIDRKHLIQKLHWDGLKISSAVDFLKVLFRVINGNIFFQLIDVGHSRIWPQWSKKNIVHTLGQVRISNERKELHKGHFGIKRMNGKAKECIHCSKFSKDITYSVCKKL